MRVFLSAVSLMFAMPSLALADPSTTPGYTAKDQAQFAKLAAGNGTWACKDTPADKKPDVITATQDGNYYVWTETGDQPSTTYARWNHTLQAYTQVEIDKSGSSEIYTTKSPEPFTATWTPLFPTGVGLYPVTMSLSGNTITTAGKYKDPKSGKVVAFKSACTKS